MRARNKQFTPQEKRSAEAAQEKLLRTVLSLTKRTDTPHSFTRAMNPILSRIISNKRGAL